MLVVVHHTAQKASALTGGAIPAFEFGAIGVDLFFMISGFIIYFVTANKSTTHLEFFEKRLVRIFPLYWALSLLALLVFIAKPGLINSNANVPTDVVASFLLWPTVAPYLVNNGWTLTYEIMFYVLWGIVVLPKATNKRALIACCLLLGAALLEKIIDLDPKILNLSLFIEFSAGVLVGIAFKKGWLRPNLLLSAFLLVIGTALAFAVMHSGASNSPYRGFFLLFPVSMMFLGIVFAGPLWRRAGWVLRTGDSSYSLYLFHPFILVFIPILVRLTGQRSVLAVFLISAGVAIASVVLSFLLYKLIELPMTNKLRKLVGGIRGSSRQPA